MRDLSGEPTKRSPTNSREEGVSVRIVDFETFLVSHQFPEKDLWWGGGWDQDLVGLRFNAVILRVKTDEGITGLGEAMPWGDCRAVQATLQQLEADFVGKDPFEVEKLTVPGPDARRNSALAAVDVALWDIIGKATNTPVFRLLAQDGDVQPKAIRTYASGGVGYAWFKRPEQVVEEALRHKEAGFTAFKMRIGSAWGTSKVTIGQFGALLEKVRAALGDDVDLMLDANGRFQTVEEAVDVAHVLESLQARWFEEPVSPFGAGGPERYNQIRARTSVPISGGEGFNSLEQHQPFLKARAYDIVQPDATFIGMSRAYQIARQYHQIGRPCIPHSWTTAIAQMANAHLVASIPNRVMLEIQQISNPLLTDLVDNPLSVDQGFVEVSERPGLGIELVEDALTRYPFSENGIWVNWPRT